MIGKFVASAIMSLIPLSVHAAPESEVGGSALSLLMVGFMAFIALCLWWASTSRNGGSRNLGKVIAHTQLGVRDKMVFVRMADDSIWVIGVGSAGISRLGELPPGSVPAEVPCLASSGVMGKFSDLLAQKIKTVKT